MCAGRGGDGGPGGRCAGPAWPWRGAAAAWRTVLLLGGAAGAAAAVDLEWRSCLPRLRKDLHYVIY